MPGDVRPGFRFSIRIPVGLMVDPAAPGLIVRLRLGVKGPVREIDALGGEMGINADKTLIQMKMLNSSKGPAVRSLRAQADKIT